MRLTVTKKISKKLFEKKFENIKKIRNFQFFPNAGTVEENTWHINVLLIFLSLRYGALGRSRHVVSVLTIMASSWKVIIIPNEAKLQKI